MKPRSRHPKVLYLHNIMHTFEDLTKVKVLYDIHVKSQEINKTLTKLLLISKDVLTDDGQQK